MNDGGHRLGLMRLCVIVPWKRFVRHIRFISLLDLCVPLTPNLYAHPQIWWLVCMETSVMSRVLRLSFRLWCELSVIHVFFPADLSHPHPSVCLHRPQAGPAPPEKHPDYYRPSVLWPHRIPVLCVGFILILFFQHHFCCFLFLGAVAMKTQCSDSIDALIRYFSFQMLRLVCIFISYTSMNIIFSSSYAHHSTVCQVIYSLRFNRSLIFFDSEYV